jgi:hypothetical protein
MKNLSVIFVLLLITSPSNACTVRKIDAPDVLILRADAIYRANANEYVVPINTNSQAKSPLVTFVILETIKGPSKKSIQFPGALTQLNDKNDMAAPYDFVRPAGRRGNCFATTYKLGQEYLLFIKGGTPYWSRLAPTNEEVAGKTDAWVVWARQNTARLTRNLTTQSRGPP